MLFYNYVHTSASSAALVLFARTVAAVPTTVAAIAIEATVSGRAEETNDDCLLLCSRGFTLTEEQKSQSNQ